MDKSRTQDKVSEKKAPQITDYATIEGVCDGAPIYSFGNIIYVYGQSPDLAPGQELQEGNKHKPVKIKLKKSWEIKHNLCGSEHEMTVRTPANDAQPLLPIHLIDGDPKTVWSSWGCAVPDGRPEWIRIDLPTESEVASVALVAAREFPGPVHGKSFPKEVEIQVSRDAWHWDTVYQSKDVPVDDLKLDVAFKARTAKQILIKANNFPKKSRYEGHIFSIGGVEVRDAAGANLALVSRCAGVTVSSTSYEMMNDRYTQDTLWGPLQYDLGNKWVRVGGDNGSFIWPYVEHEKGKLQIDARADESITECKRNGVNVILTLDFKGNWTYMNPPRKLNWSEARYRELNDLYNDPPGPATANPEMFAAYLKYIEYMVRQFKDCVEYFEIGNEWNLASIDAPTYMKEIFEPTFQVIKRVAPDAKVMLGNPCNFDPNLLLDCLRTNGTAAKVDGVGWHPQNRPDTRYFGSVRQFQKQCADLGFKGRFFATEIYAGSILPAGEGSVQPHTNVSEDQEARFLLQSAVGHAGLDMEAGPCHPNFTGWPHPQTLVRLAWPSQIITPCQPKMIYYMWRNLATVMDDFHPADVPVEFSPEANVLSFGFRRGEKELLVAMWLNDSWEGKTPGAKADLTLPGFSARQAWVIDIKNGTEQELDIAVQGKDTVIKGMKIKDVPIFIRLEKS